MDFDARTMHSLNFLWSQCKSLHGEPPLLLSPFSVERVEGLRVEVYAILAGGALRNWQASL